jgi:transposase
MPINNFLSPKQKKDLQQALKEDECPHFREHILITLLLNDGKTQQEVAEFIGCSLRTVNYCWVHGNPDDLDSYRDQREKGNHQKATKEYIELLLDVIEKDPSEFGYEFGRWTMQRLATHLAEKTGIILSSSQVRRILKRKKYSYIWAKYSLEDKQDPKKRNEFRQKLDSYLEKARENPKELQVWFWDESGFSLRVIRRKSWGKKGKRKKLPGQRRQGRVNIMGGLRSHDKKRLCFFIEKGDGDSFFEQLKQFQEFVKKEWIEQGGKVEDFATKGTKIVIILDNASYHKRSDILEKIKNDLPNIILEFLPEYSPDFNLIELVWHSCKEYIAGQLFKSVDKLKDLLDKLLNQGGLTIIWNRKIKNKGNLVNAN